MTPLSLKFGEVCDPLHCVPHHGQKTKTVQPYRRVVIIDDNGFEKAINRRTQSPKGLHHRNRLSRSCRSSPGTVRPFSVMECGFGSDHKQTGGGGGKGLFGFAFFGIQNAEQPAAIGQQAGALVTSKEAG